MQTLLTIDEYTFGWTVSDLYTSGRCYIIVVNGCDLYYPQSFHDGLRFLSERFSGDILVKALEGFIEDHIGAMA